MLCYVRRRGVSICCIISWYVSVCAQVASWYVLLRHTVMSCHVMLWCGHFHLSNANTCVLTAYVITCCGYDKRVRKGNKRLRSDLFEGGKDVQVPSLRETGNSARFLAQNRRPIQWQNSCSIQLPDDPAPAADQSVTGRRVGRTQEGEGRRRRTKTYTAYKA